MRAVATAVGTLTVIAIGNGSKAGIVSCANVANDPATGRAIMYVGDQRIDLGPLRPQIR
jgi:hypothetical protein